jgi:hypothetical protein
VSKNTNKVSRQVQLQKAVVGLGKRFSSGTTIQLGGVSYTPADLEKAFQKELDEMSASSAARAAYLTQVEQERSTRTQVSPLFRMFKNYVLATFGDTQNATAVLEDFGFSPRKVRKSTVKAKAQAEVKAEATRAAEKPAVPEQKAETPPPAEGATQPKKG